MLTRKKILANVQDCSVEDLVEAILNKTVTMYELKSCGLLPKQQKLVQNALKDIREGHISSNHVNDDFPSEISVDNDPYNTEESTTVVTEYNQSSNVCLTLKNVE